ncbi:MAG TPA: TIGR02996 domain-containing protein, partial [Gemmataceae bacterium]|nr:TIGR02996 domain-containing protein [Gemmataceae bacterium]
MTDEPTLLAAVLADPGDDAPRLVYADWLDEHGQPDRAEFIRVQIELTRTPVWDPRRPGLERREADLLAEHQIEWAAPLLDAGAQGWAFRRGFLDRVVLNVADFLKYGSAVIERTTARGLSPTSADDWRSLLAHPAARHLRGVLFANMTDGDELAATLAELPELSGWRSLTLVSAGLTDSGLARLAAAPHLAGLEHLAVGSDDLTAAGLRALPGATFAESLRYLGVGMIAAPPTAFAEFVAARNWHRLTELGLDGNDLGGGHLRRLVAGARLNALLTLSLKVVGVGEDPEGLAAVLELPRLARLLLHQDAGTPAVRALLEAPAVRRYVGVVLDEFGRFRWTEPEPVDDRLEIRIDSSRADMGGWLKDAGFLAPDATAALCGPGDSREPVPGPWPALPGQTVVPIEFTRPAAGRPVHSVRVTCYLNQRHNEKPAPPPFLPALAAAGSDGPRLMRRGCEVWEDWPERWRRFLSGAHVHRLNLWSERGVRDADLQELLALPAFARLRDLDLGGTAITLAGVRDLVNSHQASGLRRLRLSFNELGDELAEVIAAAPTLAGLVSLKLSFCSIGDRGAAALAASPHLRRLTTLKLWGGRGVNGPTNPIGDAGAAAIADSPTLAKLMGLRLRGNDIGDAGAKALAASPHLKWMRDLNIAENPIGPDGIRALEGRFGGRLGYCIGDAEPLP